MADRPYRRLTPNRASGVTSYGITQCYLLPDTSERLNTSPQAGTRFTYPAGTKGWVDLGAWVYTYLGDFTCQQTSPIQLLLAQCLSVCLSVCLSEPLETSSRNSQGIILWSKWRTKVRKWLYRSARLVI